MYMATAICTSPLGGLLSNAIGRRKSFLILVTTGIIGFVTIALSPNIPALFVGRFMTIVCSSAIAPTISVQIAETVHADLRGSFAVFHSLFDSLGILIVLSFGYLVSDWRTLAWICIVPGCIQLPIVFFFLCDTPYWLVEKDRWVFLAHPSFYSFCKILLKSFMCTFSIQKRRGSKVPAILPWQNVQY